MEELQHLARKMAEGSLLHHMCACMRETSAARKSHM
jgi:hypothetical protein